MKAEGHCSWLGPLLCMSGAHLEERGTDNKEEGAESEDPDAIEGMTEEFM